MFTLIDRFNIFMRATSAEKMASSEQIVYLRLLSMANSFRFHPFRCSDRRLQDLTGLGSGHTVTNAKNKLKQKGWITFSSKTKGTTTYKVLIPKWALTAAEGAADGAADSAAICGSAADGAADGAADSAADSAADTAADSAAEGAADTAALNRTEENRQDENRAAAAAATCARATSPGDPRLSRLVSFWEGNTGLPMTPVFADILRGFLDSMPVEVVEEAMREAVLAGANNPRYVERVLMSWNSAGVHSSQALNQYRASRKQGRKASRQEPPSADWVPTYATDEENVILGDKLRRMGV